MDSTSDQQYNSNQNFGLTPDEFSALLKKMLNGNEMLFEIIFKTHFEKCRSFLIRKLGVDYDVAYDITLETLIKFRKNLMLGKIKYGNMAALFTIDARNNYLRWNEKETRYEHISLESGEQDLIDDYDDSYMDAEMIDKLKRALLSLGNDCYEILNWHYYLGMPLKTIAENRFERGDVNFVNESGVKTKISECRKKLRNLLG
jgi:DNA-directed RNA polymerase specialized sigma24 family protein